MISGGGVAPTKEEATSHFTTVQATLHRLGIDEAKHKACPPAQVMIWLGLHFDTTEMTITIPPAKLTEIEALVAEWQGCKY